MIIPSHAISFATAVGIGLLIGAERERRKGSGTQRGAAGVRTFALASLAGALSMYLQNQALLIAVSAGAVLFSALAYRHTAQRDPGLTSEFALLVTVLLGALTMQNPLLGAPLGVITTILLASRDRLHRLLKNLLTEQEAHDALVFLAATLVILPLTPNRALGPFDTFNPRRIWELVVLIMAIGGASYIALRAFGSRLGFALAGLIGGFISATATIGSMGARAWANQALRRAATSGAVLATVATVAELALVLLATNLDSFQVLRLPLLLGGIAASAYALIFVIRASGAAQVNEPAKGRAFDLRLAFFFAGTVSAILFFCGLLNQRYGARGVLVAAALSGFADAHATAISIASLVSASKLNARSAATPILLGFATNSISKAVMAFTMGGFRFGLQIVVGLVLVVLAAFLGLWLTGL